MNPPNPNGESRGKKPLEKLGFDTHTFVDLVGMVYNLFHEERCDLCWKNKDQEEDWRRTASMNLETFCRVLPLLVETCGCLIPPLRSLLEASKHPMGQPRDSPDAANFLNLGWLPLPQDNMYIRPRIHSLYIGKYALTLTLIGLTSWRTSLELL